MCKKLVCSFYLALLLCLVGSVSADIELDSASSSASSAGGPTLSWSHTVGSGDNCILVVGIASEDGSETQLIISSITYGSAEMTLVEGSSVTTETGYFLKTELYYLLSPAPGTDTITIIYSGNITSISAGAISMFNVEQQPREAVATNWNNYLDSISTDITTQTDGAWIVDVVGCSHPGSFSPTAGGMAERFDVSTTTASGAGCTKLAAAAGSTTVGWAHSGPNRLAHSAAAFAAIPQPEKATNPTPSNEAVDVPPYTDLSWTAGVDADSHDVYFGTDFNDVKNADNFWPVGVSVYKGNQPIDANMYEPGILESKQTYYWRIDETIDGDPESPYEGYVWTFTVERYTAADFDSNGFVNIEDLAIMAYDWLNSGGELVADADWDGKVDLRDYAILADNWLIDANSIANECENWQLLHPEWIFCDDFEDGTALVRQGRYFEHSSDGGDFVPMEGVGVEGSKGMRVRWQPGEVSAGSLHLAFGRVPSGSFNKGIRSNEDFTEIYYRMYLKMQENWQGGDPAKLSRAFIFPGANNAMWSQAMIVHLWGGGANRLKLEPVSLVNADGVVLSTRYNDFDNMEWLNKHGNGIGDPDGITPIFAPEYGGVWYCIEAHVRLNDSAYGIANGLQEFWIDGQLEARRIEMNFVKTYDDYGINAIFFENYWNSGSPVTQERYFDNIVVSTEPIGCGCE